MAKSYLELAVDSGNWDNGLRKAQSSLNAFVNSAGGMSNALASNGDKVEEFIKMMGDIESNAKTARGQVNDYKNSIEQLSHSYNQLSDAEKEAHGEAFQESIGKLNTKMKEAKSEADETAKSMNTLGSESGKTGGIMDELAGKFGLNITKLGLLGAGLAAAKGALNVATDAFMASEANVDEWGRTTEAAGALYEGFLFALNTGDISGYLSNIDSIVEAARDAYDAIDRLGTMKRINDPVTLDQETENERFRQMLATGKYIAPRDGRKPTPGLKEGQVLTPEQLKRVQDQLQHGLNKVTTIREKEVKQSNVAVEALYKRYANVLGMSLSEFKKGTSSVEEFERRVAGGEKYKKWEKEHSFIDQKTGKQISYGVNNPYKQYKGWSDFRVDGDEYNNIITQVREREAAERQLYSARAQAYRTMNRAENRINGGGHSGGGGGGQTNMLEGGFLGLPEFKGQTIQTTESMKELQAQLADFKSMLANAVTPDQYYTATAGIASTQQKMGVQETAVRLGVSTDSIIELEEQMQTALQDLSNNLEPLEIKVSTESVDDMEDDLVNSAEKTKAAWTLAANSVSTIGSALQQIEDPSAKVAGIVGQAVAQIALGFATASAQAATAGPIAWIAAAVGGLATMFSTIQAIKSATAGYSGGGMIYGNSYSGDNQWARVNAGELILNRAQQSNIAAQLQSNQVQSAQPYMTGEVIYLGVNNYLRSAGLGQLVTTK